jgi:hypothetical protein
MLTKVEKQKLDEIENNVSGEAVVRVVLYL